MNIMESIHIMEYYGSHEHPFKETNRPSLKGETDFCCGRHVPAQGVAHATPPWRDGTWMGFQMGFQYLIPNTCYLIPIPTT